VAPLRLGGLRGKQSTPSDWLGGTGEVSTVGERERHGARFYFNFSCDTVLLLKSCTDLYSMGFLGINCHYLAIKKEKKRKTQMMKFVTDVNYPCK
jgi:hypothetical protein